MDRLTRRDKHGDVWGAKRSVGDYVGDREIRQRLAAYEDIGTPEQCAAGVALMQNQEQGLVVELPVLPGEKRNGMSIKMVGVASNGNYVIEYWEKDGVSGGYVREILTRAEAEKSGNDMAIDFVECIPFGGDIDIVSVEVSN